jgi:hypothetical protein
MASVLGVCAGTWSTLQLYIRATVLIDVGSLVHWFIGSLVHWLVQYSARKGDTVVPQSASSAVCLICNQQRDSQIEPDFALECGHAYVAHHESNGSLEQLTNTMMQLAAFTSHAFAVG